MTHKTRLTLSCFAFVFPAFAHAQSCSLTGNQKTLARTVVTTGFIGGNVELWHYFKQAWWSGEKAKHFFFRSDWDEDFRDQDKFGHLLGGYQLTRAGYEALRTTCVSQKKAVIGAVAYAALFQLQIEVFDGMYQKYGFSYADMIANTTGQTLGVLEELHPHLRWLKPTISYSPSAAMRNRANFTQPSELRRSLDYSGQTYWFSADVQSVLPHSVGRYWPSLLRASVGHSITDYIDPVTGASHRAKRKLLLSLDIDPEKLPGNNRLWKAVKHQISYYHFPSPALQLTPTFRGLKWYR
ncbi:MAG: DUF2279 domain-containing protein [Gemmatimonadaceae bacterium]